MSFRVNSLRIVVVDTLFYMGIMSLAAASWTAAANGAEPRIVRLADAATENRPSSDHVDSRLNTDDTPASGIPEESPAAKRESMMLGMKLFERAAGNIEVVDVAAASPAWDAGIRPGDRLREIDGVKPRRLAAWVEDVGKVLANTEDGKSVAAEVERDGYPMQVRIKMPVSNAAQARDARKQDEELARMQAREQRQMRNGQQDGGPMGVAAVDRNDYGPGQVAGGYGGYGGWGMGGFFDDGGAAAGGDANGGDRMATSAAAPLMAVNTLGRGGAGGAQAAGGQVGMAGFQNSGDGVEAMVVVRGLPQGTYQVGIGSGGEFGTDGSSNLVGPDANAAGFGLQPALEGTADSYNRGGAGPNQQQPGVNQRGAAPGMRDPNGNQVPNQQQPGFVPPGGQTPVVPQGGVPGGAAPGGVAPGAGGGTGGGGAAPAGGDGASIANPRNAILAQQLDTQQPAGGAQNATRPAQPSAFPAHGQNPAAAQRNNNGSATASGANPYDPRDRAEAQRQAQQGNNPLGGTGGSPMVATIGTLQIGAEGSGQVQNRLPGMSVRNLAGMQVIVQSTNWGGGAGGTAVDPRVAQNPAQNPAAQNQIGQNQNQSAQGQARVPQGNPGQQVGQQPLDANGQPTRGAQGIVAAGTIQLRGGGTGANQPTGANPNAVDEAMRREQGRSQISDPTQDFNPSNPLE